MKRDGEVELSMCFDHWEQHQRMTLETHREQDTVCRLVPDPVWMPLLPRMSLRLSPME